MDKKKKDKQELLRTTEHCILTDRKTRLDKKDLDKQMTMIYN